MTSRITRARSLRAVSSAPSATTRSSFSRRSAGDELLVAVGGGLFTGGERLLEGRDALVKRADRVLGVLERRFLGGEGAGEDAGALQHRRALLGELLNGRVAVDAVGVDVGEPRTQGVALKRKPAHAPVAIAELLGAGEQVAARLAQQPLGRAGARLQGLEARALVGALMLVALVGLLEGARKPRAFGVQLGEIGFDLAQPALRGVQTRLHFGQLA
jgi:hypothetical protein